MRNRNHSSAARKHQLACRAREMRRFASEPERILWRELAPSQLGVAFRRQVVLGNAIADFFAPSLRLVVEVDGAHHRLRRAADTRRDRDLRRLGCVVLRLDAQLVLREAPRAVALVRAVVERLR